MTETENNYLQVIVSQLDNVRDDVQELKNDLKTRTVTYSEWQLRNEYMDRRIEGAATEIDRIRHQIETARAPWYTYITVFVATGALLWSMFGPTL